MDLAKYITETNVILIPVLYVLGMFLKSTPRISDWLIPWLIVVFGITFSISIGINVGTSVVDGVIQGIIIAGITVLGNQLIKQTKKKD